MKRYFAFFVFFLIGSLQAAKQRCSTYCQKESTIATQQLSITNPGAYLIKEDLEAAPSTSNLSIILIASSNVELDLGGKTLTLSPSCYTPMKAAIELARGASNITIKNGFIQGTSDLAKIAHGVIGQDNHNIKLNSLQISSCTNSGISLDYGSKLDFRNIKILGIANSLGSTYGIKLNYCKQVSLKNNAIRNIFCYAPSPALCIGVHLEHSSQCSLNSIKISKIEATKSLSCGFYSTFSSKINGEKITSYNHSTTALLDNCYGFFIDQGDEHAFSACSSYDNTVSFSGNSYGFKISNSTLSTLEKCKSYNNYSRLGEACGYENSNSKYTQFYGCSSLYNKGQTRSFGFISTDSSGTWLKKCSSVRNKSTCGAVYGVAFYNEDTGIIRDCQITANAAPYGGAFGIAMLGSCFSNKIRANFVANNTGSGQFGFYDETELFTSSLRGNVISGHGRSISDEHKLINSFKTNYYIPYHLLDTTLLIKENTPAGPYAVPTWPMNASIYELDE